MKGASQLISVFSGHMGSDAMTGQWDGEYRYDPPHERAPVPFVLDLAGGALFRIRGTVQDGHGGMPARGRVVGWRIGQYVRFKKLMPTFMVSAGGHVVDFREYLAAHYAEAVPLDVPHPTLHYSGRLLGAGEVAGVWRVGRLVVPVGSAHVWAFPSYCGTWNAARRTS